MQIHKHIHNTHKTGSHIHSQNVFYKFSMKNIENFNGFFFTSFRCLQISLLVRKTLAFFVVVLKMMLSVGR